MSQADSCGLVSENAFVKRVSMLDPFSLEDFCEVPLSRGDTVARLAERIRLFFPSWGLNAGQLRLFLVEAAGDGNPSSEEMRTALAGPPLQARSTLEHARVACGSTLLALVPDPAAVLVPPTPRGRTPSFASDSGSNSLCDIPALFRGGPADDDFVLDGLLFSRSQASADLHLCARATQLAEPLCAKIYVADVAGAVAAATREAATGRLLRESFPAGAYPQGLIRFIAEGFLDDGRPVVIMPHFLLSCADITKRFLERARCGLRARQLARLAIGLADGLRALHALGIAHCDVKPANVMLRSDGWPVLVDLAAATRFGEKPAEVTAQWAAAGGKEAQEALLLQASPALDLHCLAATVYSAFIGSGHYAVVDSMATRAWDAKRGAAEAIAQTCWEHRADSAEGLLCKLLELAQDKSGGQALLEVAELRGVGLC